MKVKSKSEVAQSCPTLSDPMDCRDFPGKSTGVGCHCLLHLCSIGLVEKLAQVFLLRSYRKSEQTFGQTTAMPLCARRVPAVSAGCPGASAPLRQLTCACHLPVTYPMSLQGRLKTDSSCFTLWVKERCPQYHVAKW